MILLANRVSGENGVNDTTKRNLDNSDTCITSGYESSAIFVETEKSSEWKTITYEFTTHNWTNDTTGDSATDNILVLLMRGYGTAYIDNIDLLFLLYYSSYFGFYYL